MPDIKQPEPLKFIPIRKSPVEIKKERKEEVERQLDFLHSKEVKEWKEKFPEKWKADVARLEKEVPPKVVKKAPKPEKEEEPKEKKHKKLKK